MFIFQLCVAPSKRCGIWPRSYKAVGRTSSAVAPSIHRPEPATFDALWQSNRVRQSSEACTATVFVNSEGYSSHGLGIASFVHTILSPWFSSLTNNASLSTRRHATPDAQVWRILVHHPLAMRFTWHQVPAKVMTHFTRPHQPLWDIGS